MEQQEQMKSKEELKQLICKFNQEYKKMQIDIMFVRKNPTKPKTYKTYMLECGKQNLEEMIKETLNNILLELDMRTMEIYDLELSTDNTIQYVSREGVIHSDTILESLTVQYDAQNILNQEVDFDSLNFVVIQLFIPDDNTKLYLFKTHVRKTTAMRKKAVMLSFDGEEFKPITDKILTIGSNVEAFLIDDFYYILNRNKFNAMFDYKDAFVKIIDDNSDAIVATEMITNAQEFIEQCKNNGRQMPRLTKAILGNGFQNLVVYKERLKSIKDDYGLQIELTEDEKIIYEKPEDATEILNLLLDHYVISALTENKMLAKAIEKYEIG